MDRSEVKAIVDGALGPLMDRLGIGAWRVTVSYQPERADGDGHLRRGECTRLLDYDSASIVLNPESFGGPDEVMGTLRHELFHIVLAPFDLHSSAVDRALEGAHGAAREILDRVWNHSCERAVINLERMYAGLAPPAGQAGPAGTVVEAGTDGRVHLEISGADVRVLRLALDPDEAEDVAGALNKRAAQARRFVEAD